MTEYEITIYDTTCEALYISDYVVPVDSFVDKAVEVVRAYLKEEGAKQSRVYSVEFIDTSDENEKFVDVRVVGLDTFEARVRGDAGVGEEVGKQKCVVGTDTRQSRRKKVSPQKFIASVVLQKRKAVGMSRIRMSEETGIPLNTLANVESGNYDMRVSTFFEVCSHLGIDVGFLNELVNEDD